MAEAKLRLTADASQMTREIANAEDAFDGLYRAVRDNWWGIRNVGIAFAAVGGAIASGAAASVQAAAAFEAGMAQIAVRADDGKGSVEELTRSLIPLGEGLLDLALIRGVDIGRIQAIANEGLALGVATQNIVEFTGAITDLVASSDLTDASATQLAKIASSTNMPTDEFDNLGSSILAVGREMAATESTMVNLMKRIAPVGGMANLTAGQIAGLAGATLSLGPNAEAGATAIQRTLFDMSKAVVAGGKELDIFAQTAGMSGQQFAQVFNNNGGDALAAFVTGLGKASSSMTQAQEILTGLGITEVRQIYTLSALAQGTKNAENSNLNLANALKLGDDAYKSNTALSRAAEAQQATFTATLQRLKNSLVDAGIALGGPFLAPLKAAMTVLTDFLAGIRQMPAPLRLVITALLLMSAVIFGLGAAFLLIGPRIILAIGSFAAFRGMLGGVATTAGVAGAAMDKAAGSGGRLGGVLGALTTGAGRAFGALQGTAVASGEAALTAEAHAIAARYQAAALGGVAATAGGATTAVGGLAAAQATAAGTAGAAAAGTAAATGATVASAGAATVAASRFAIFGRVLGFLKGIIVSVGKFIVNVFGSKVKLAILAILALTGYIYAKGRAHRQDAKDTLDDASAQDKLNKKMKEQQAAMIAGQKAAEKTREEIKKRNEAIREQNDALKDLGQAQIDAAQAELDLKRAAEELRLARADAADRTEEIREAEADLAKAQRDSAKASRNLQKAQRKLSTARADQAADVKKAERDLAEARDNQAEAADKVQKAEKRVDELRNGPTMREVTEATNKLKNAQLALMKATRRAGDAEWYLNYLRGEGASARDIADAEFDLMEARQEVQNSTEDVTKAQEDYDDVMDPTDEQAEAARDLAEARRDQADAAQATKEAERELADARRDQAADTYYKDALADVQEAQAAVAESARAVKEAQAGLQMAKLGTEDLENVKQATLDYQKALLDAAKARAELEITQRRARGEHISDAEAAQIYAKHLDQLARTQDGKFKTSLQGMAANYRKVRDEVANTADAMEALSNMDMGDFDTFDPNADLGMDDAIEKNVKQVEQMSIKDRIINWFKREWDTILIAIGTYIVGSLVAAFFGIPALLGTAIVVLVGWIATKFWDMLPESWKKKAEEKAKDVGSWFQSIWDACYKWVTESLPKAFDGFGTFFTETLPNKIGDLKEKVGEKLDNVTQGVRDKWDDFKEAFKTFFKQPPAAMGEQLGEWTRDVLDFLVGRPIRALATGIEFFYEFGKKIPGRVMEGIKTLGKWNDDLKEWFHKQYVKFTDVFLPGVVQTGKQIPGKIMDGIIAVVDFTQRIGKWFSDKWTIFKTETFPKIQEFGKNIPGYIVAGILSVLDFKDRVKNWLQNRVGTAVTDAGQWLKDTGKYIIEMIAYGLSKAFGGAFSFFGGFLKGLLGDSVVAQVKNAINSCLYLLNVMLHKIGSIRINIPQVNVPGVGKIGGGSIGLPYFQVPYLAKGGVVNDPTLAMIGERGPEAVIPIDRLMSQFDRMDSLSAQIAATNRSVQMLLQSGMGSVTGGDTFNLTAITDADPVDIADEFMWAKMVRTR